MEESTYPLVTLEFLTAKILSSGQIIENSEVKVGNTTTFMLKGSQEMRKRIILIRSTNEGEVNFGQASGLALRLRFMGELLNWFLENKNWKEGGYVVSNHNPVGN